MVDEWATVRHRVAMAGIVVDDISGKPVAGAYVEITDKPEAYARKLALDASQKRTDVAHTRSNGLFFFLDLPEGDYGLTAFLPRQPVRVRHESANQQDLFERIADKRYGKGAYKASVADSAVPDSRNKLAVVRLPPTGIRGRVIHAANQAAVPMAEIRVKGSGESGFTDERGQYTILGIWPDAQSQRILEVRARGYRDDAVPALIDKPGTCIALPDITLVPQRG